MSLFNRIKRITLLHHEIILVIFLALLMTFISTIAFFSQLYFKPSNHVFIGVTHYFEDFFYYLDQFYQGAHGSWLTVNNFTSEYLPPTLLYFDNIILGKIGGMIGLEPFTAYNVSLLILKFVYLILSYFIVKIIFPTNRKMRLGTYLFFLFATSFPDLKLTDNGLINQGPLLIYRAKNTIFSRFGNIPSQYMTSILFTVLFILSCKIKKLIFLQFKIQKKKFVILSVTMAGLLLWLTVSDAAKAFVYMFILLLVLYFFRPDKVTGKQIVKPVVFYFSLLFVFLITSSLMYKTVANDPVYKAANEWDYKEYINQFGYIKPLGYVKSFGPLGMLFLLGSYFLFKKKKEPIEKLILTVSLASILGFILPSVLEIPVPGFRFVLKSSYIFISAVGIYSLYYLENIKKIRVFSAILAFYIILAFITFYPTLKQQAAKVKEPDFHFTYMPNSIYDGLSFLANIPPKDAIVLGNSSSATDLFIPGFTGKKTYTGHFLTNIDSKFKDEQNKKFYYEWTDKKDGLEFLTKNNIKYVVHTVYANNFENKELETYYPFLKEVYRNKMMAIYTY
jgi:hypothetical protein